MGKLVLHMQKVKVPAVMNSIGEENDRETEQEIEKQRSRNSTIDGTKTKENFDALDGIEHDLKMTERVDKRMKNGYTSKRKIRKDAVRLVDGVIGSDATFFEGMDLQKRKQFATDCAAFLVQKVGRENVVGCRWHNDENPPHLHFQFVPLVDGKLHAKSFGFTKGGLQEWHTELAKFLQERGWEIERGTMRQEWEKPVQHLEPNEFKRKHYSENVPSKMLEKILHEIDGKTDISKPLFADVRKKETTATMTEKNYRKLREIAGEVVALRHRVEQLEPLEKELEQMRERYAKKVKSVDDNRLNLERQLVQVKNKNEQEKYKRMQLDLADARARVAEKEKELDRTLQEIKSNQKTALEMADAIIEKAHAGDEKLKGMFNQTFMVNAMNYLAQHDPDTYKQILEIGRKETLAQQAERHRERPDKEKGKGYSRQ